MATKSKKELAGPARFEPELDGQGKVLSPVKAKHLPRAAAGESALASALRQAMGRKDVSR